MSTLNLWLIVVIGSTSRSTWCVTRARIRIRSWRRTLVYSSSSVRVVDPVALWQRLRVVSLLWSEREQPLEELLNKLLANSVDLAHVSFFICFDKFVYWMNILAFFWYLSPYNVYLYSITSACCTFRRELWTKKREKITLLLNCIHWVFFRNRNVCESWHFY